MSVLPTDPWGVDATLPRELRDLRREVRSYLDHRVAPLVADAERSHAFPHEILPELYEFGYVRGAVPVADGGDGADHLTQAVLMEEAGRCWGSLRTTLNIQTMVAVVLAAHGTGKQKSTYLAPVLAGTRRGFFALTESEAGSDAAALRTTARPSADGGFVLDGRKLYITNASTGDFGLVFASEDRTAGGRGVTAFVVDRGDGVQTREIAHLPVRATSSCEVVLDGVHVPEDAVLGERRRGLSVGLAAVNLGRLNMSMGAVGIIQACLEEAVRHATVREQFGKPLAAFQLVQDMVVRIATLGHSARLVGYQAARSLDGGSDGRLACSTAKLYCCESATEAASLALQVHGGAGLMEESPVERLFRDAREGPIPEGTSQMQVLHIGKALLGVSALR